jgi:hypothetical protein
VGENLLHLERSANRHHVTAQGGTLSGQGGLAESIAIALDDRNHSGIGDRLNRIPHHSQMRTPAVTIDLKDESHAFSNQ